MYRVTINRRLLQGSQDQFFGDIQYAKALQLTEKTALFQCGTTQFVASMLTISSTSTWKYPSTLNKLLKDSLMARDCTAVFREDALPDIQGSFEILIVETTLQCSCTHEGPEIEGQVATWLVSFNPTHEHPLNA